MVTPERMRLQRRLEQIYSNLVLFARSLKMPFEVYILGRNPNLNLVIS